MPYKQFDPDLIEKRNNPFHSTRSVSICEGVFLKDTPSVTYVLSTQIPVEVGMLKKLQKTVHEIRTSMAPQHVLLLAEYGHGKSFALKAIQDDIYKKYGGPLITYTLGDSEEKLRNRDYFSNKIMEDLEYIFDNLNPTDYPNKAEISARYKLDTEDKSFIQSLKAWDSAFKDLRVLVFIFLDEIDKVITSGLDDATKRKFLQDLKTIADNCSLSISLFIAGTPPCKKMMDDFGFDYRQRFNPEETNRLNEDETHQYVTKKCLTLLEYYGQIPFTKNCTRKIYHFTKGNIRYIESLSRKLWNHAHIVRMKIDEKLFDGYMESELKESIKNRLGNDLRDSAIRFISKLVLKGGKIGIQTAFDGFQPREKLQIQEYIDANPSIVKVVSRSYRLESLVKEDIIKHFIGVE